MLRALRVLRVVRLLRLAKLRQLINAFQDRVDSEYLSVAVSLLQLLLMIVSINHFVACGWYLLSSSLSKSEERWVDIFASDDDTYVRYFVSIHWSITQFTPGSMPVQPQNLSERVFAIGVLLLGLVVFSSFVSSITSTMTRLRNLNAKHATQNWLLRKYLREHSISRELCARVNRYVAVVVFSQQKFTQQKDVALLALLSGPLHIELQKELWKPKLVLHPFFSRLDHKCQDIMRDVCCNCVTQVLLSRGDVLFGRGKEATHMYFLWRGFMSYDSRDVSQGHGTEVMTLQTGEWCCEAVLFTRWIHQGRMRAKIECDLMALDGSKFRDILKQHPAHFGFPLAYAQAFIESLVTSKKTEPVHDMQMSFLNNACIQQHVLIGKGSSGATAPNDPSTSVSTAVGIASRMSGTAKNMFKRG
eukprot:gnl/TRDRNA2_/TRDRNA2_96373_c0_seq1.p1 gnl/TRDRNA2_/TRDRNA2_96373_c0~~gnl/TRDRNA2_/TRDRNA2_96373_c0_seq1.p1  ORF type:complete len:436 (-),score=53.06 gnl/TRDRNA2_/TRDRNA2_96373_c0_seq1:34-1281(-)